MGRPTASENADICGVYVFVKNLNGFPAYQNRTTQVVIRWYAPSRRWLVDRGGFRNSEVCVAFANEISGLGHPAHPNMVWYIWDTKRNTHAKADEVSSVDAPQEFTFSKQGGPEQENFIVNGKYVLHDIAHSRPMYLNSDLECGTAMWFNPREQRWCISDRQNYGSDIVCAYAAVGHEFHPLDPSLQWWFWESSKEAFVLDPTAGSIDAPESVHVLCPNPQAPQICGTYQLYGIQHGKPVYLQTNGPSVIRCSSDGSKWLIDCDGRQQPGLLTKFHQWIMTGSSDDARERCTAWAAAQMTNHPGHLNLQWHVWDQAGQRHVPDTTLVCTGAPLHINVTGQIVSRDNFDVAGNYNLQGSTATDGIALYSKPGTNICIYYSKSKRWVIDRHGTADNGVCVAYADTKDCQEYPSSELTWHAFDRSTGGFKPDPSMRVKPIDLQAGAAISAIPMSAVNDQFEPMEYGCVRPGRSIQRGDPYSMFQAPDAKMGQQLPRQGWLGSIFGA